MKATLSRAKAEIRRPVRQSFPVRRSLSGGGSVGGSENYYITNKLSSQQWPLTYTSKKIN